MNHSWFFAAAAVAMAGCAARSGSGPRSEASPTDNYQAGTTTANLDRGSTAGLPHGRAETQPRASAPGNTTEATDQSGAGMQPASGPGTGSATTSKDIERRDDDKDHKADNSGINERDRSNRSLTPTDQGGGETDRKITQEIRQAVLSDKSLSFGAKNIKIITSRGKVTLRGPVKSETERSAIEAIAKQVAGVANVENLLEISK